MEEQYYALYVEGREDPIGTLRDSTLGVVDGISGATGKKYRTEPISSGQATAITKSITRLSPNIEKFIC